MLIVTYACKKNTLRPGKDITGSFEYTDPGRRSLKVEFQVESKELKEAGLKATLPRIRILQILEESDQKHLSAEDVYKALLDMNEEVGLATVYRVLTQFESAGLVTRHNFDSGHSVFELDRGGHHDHMVCVKTGKVIEFKNEEIERLQEEIAKKHGYSLESHSLVLYVKPIEK